VSRCFRFTPKDVEEKLENIVSQTLKYRDENNVVRNDFLHILHQMMKECKDGSFTSIDVTAHAAGFFGDGYETSSVVMHFILYQLAADLDSQTKLRREINKVFQQNDNTLPYEELQKMPYLDAVFNGIDIYLQIIQFSRDHFRDAQSASTSWFFEQSVYRELHLRSQG
jgi:cytochrome P450